jgi:phosphomannomutase
MSSVLMKSVSGIRGIVGDTVTPELINEVGAAFAGYVKKGTVVVGRDGRCTGEAVSKMLEAVLVMSGCNVVDVGIVPTPTVQIMVEELNAAGGIVISASHNPIEWNAFKLINSDGTFLNSTQVERFFALMEKDKKYEKWNKLGKFLIDDRAFYLHINKILQKINYKKIKRKRFKVALDSVNASGSYITQDLLEKLKCKVNTVFCEITGTFPRIAEPRAENIKELSGAVIEHGSDIGFAQDPDADRLVIVDEKGVAVSEELTVALVVEHLLSKITGPVVVNMSTTKVIEDIAKKHGARFFRSKVGEINVVEVMRKKQARIGGEGNGGVIAPDIHLGRDSLVGIAYILEMMAERKKTISELISELPVYVMKKGKVPFAKNRKMDSLYNKIKKQNSSEKFTEIDGLRIDFVKNENFKGGWVHLRASNTEPIFRIITEGKDSKQAQAIYSHFAKLLK